MRHSITFWLLLLCITVVVALGIYGTLSWSPRPPLEIQVLRQLPDPYPERANGVRYQYYEVLIRNAGQYRIHVWQSGGVNLPASAAECRERRIVGILGPMPPGPLPSELGGVPSGERMSPPGDEWRGLAMLEEALMVAESPPTQFEVDYTWVSQTKETAAKWCYWLSRRVPSSWRTHVPLIEQEYGCTLISLPSGSQARDYAFEDKAPPPQFIPPPSSAPSGH